MIKWAPFPFVRFTLAFMAGILLGLKAETVPLQMLYLFLPVFALYGGLFFFSRQRASATLFSVTGMVGLLALVLAGWSLVQLRTQKNDPHHLLHQSGAVTHYQGYLNDFLLEKPSVFQTTLKLQQVKINNQWVPVTGQVQVSFKKESGLEKPQYGDVLLIKGTPKVVPEPLNPGQFNFREFLENKNIYHQHYLYAGQFMKTGEDIRNPVLALSIKLRQNLDRIFRQNLESKREYSIVSALVLGIKDDLDNSVKAAFSNTGTMHVLAVSGLHVGMVFLVLTTGLRGARVFERQKWLKAILLLAFIWTYAFITALSPSVLRATVMFSFIIGAELIGRKGNTYNTLAAAAFLLLCFNTFYLVDLGFLLSFLAVFSIVFLQPKIYNLFTVRNWFLDKVWALTSVSIAAQLGTMFLSLAFFHQFPVYFLFSNLIAVPAAFLILYGGLALLVLGWVPLLGETVGFLLEKLVWLLNEAMLLLESWPGAVITRIPFSGWQAVLCYVFLFLVFVFLARKKLKYLALASVVLLVFSGSRMADNFSAAAHNKLMIYAVPKASVWAIFENQQATVLADSAFLQNKKAQDFTLEPAFLQAQISHPKFLDRNQPMPASENINFRKTEEMNLLVWRGKKLLALEKTLGKNLQKPAETDYLVLQKNVYFTPEKLQQNFRFKKIILDSSNDQWYWQRAEKQLEQAGIPYHNVARHGAFVLTE